jgi:hypothetical protein
MRSLRLGHDMSELRSELPSKARLLLVRLPEGPVPNTGGLLRLQHRLRLVRGRPRVPRVLSEIHPLLPEVPAVPLGMRNLQGPNF